MSFARTGIGTEVAIPELAGCRNRQVSMRWTPNRVTLLRVVVGFAAVCLFGRGAWANLMAVGLTVAQIARVALDGTIARCKKQATAFGGALAMLVGRMARELSYT